MAKKKAKRKAPTRACEGCGTHYHPRSGKCPKCGRANPTLHGVGKKRKGGKVSGDAVSAAIDFVEQAGSVKAARAAFDRLEQVKSL